MAFERIASEEIWKGHIGGIRVDTFRYDDGAQAKREIVTHPGAVTVLPFDGERIWLVRQPREPVGEQALLELPAGKIDVDGEELEATARRELAEEIGKGARAWRHLVSFYNSPGLLSEENHLFLAQDLYDERRDAEEEERIEIVPLALERLNETIPSLRDAKTLIGLLWFSAFLPRSLSGPRVTARLHAQGMPAGRAKGSVWPQSSSPRTSARSSTWCSTSSPTSSSSAACLATRSRPTAPTCCSSDAS